MSLEVKLELAARWRRFNRFNRKWTQMDVNQETKAVLPFGTLAFIRVHSRFAFAPAGGGLWRGRQTLHFGWQNGWRMCLAKGPNTTRARRVCSPRDVQESAGC